MRQRRRSAPCTLRPVIIKSFVFVLAYACAFTAAAAPFALSALAENASHWEAMFHLLRAAASFGYAVAPYAVPLFLLVACLDRSPRAFALAGFGLGLVCSSWLLFVVAELPQSDALIGCLTYAGIGLLGGLVFGVVYCGLMLGLDEK